MLINNTSIPALERRYWWSPACCSWSSGRNIGRNLTMRPEPNVYSCTLPLHSIHTASIGVETITISIGCSSGRAAAIVAVVRVTITSSKSSAGLHTGHRGHTTAWGSVQSDGIGAGGVYTFYDVYFTWGWPVGTEHPEGRPYTADTARPGVTRLVKWWDFMEDMIFTYEQCQRWIDHGCMLCYCILEQSCDLG